MNAKKRAMIIYQALAEIPMRLLGTGNRGKLEVINNCSDRGSEPDICHNRFDNRGKLEFQLILGNCTPHCKINYKSLVLVMLYQTDPPSCPPPLCLTLPSHTQFPRWAPLPSSSSPSSVHLCSLSKSELPIPSR